MFIFDCSLSKFPIYELNFKNSKYLNFIHNFLIELKIHITGVELLINNCFMSTKTYKSITFILRMISNFN